MRPKQLFKTSLDVSTAIFSQIRNIDFENQTPCSEWDLKILANHMLYELNWVPDLLAGKTVKQVGSKYDGNLMEGNYLKAWQRAAQKANKAVQAANLNALVHLSYADVSASSYIKEIGGDLIIHSWDLAQGLFCSLWLKDQVLKTIYNNLLPRKTELVNSGLFAQPIETASSDIQIKLLGLVGRRIPSI